MSVTWRKTRYTVGPSIEIRNGGMYCPADSDRQVEVTEEMMEAWGYERVEEPITIWAVVFSNYEPAEVMALYDNPDAADEHADAEDGPLRVVSWEVSSTYTPEEK